MDTEDLEYEGTGQDLVGYVMDKVNDWDDYYQANYADEHSEYYRLFAGIWSEQDKTRASERSKIISPALSQAVESAAAEIEEATFGRGPWFDIRDNMGDEQPQDTEYIKNKLMEDFKRAQIRPALSEVILTSAIYGTGFLELCLEEHVELTPAQRPVAEGQMVEVGVEKKWRTLVTGKSILPQNLKIDPLATSIKSATGVAVDEFVSLDYVTQMQESGYYVDEYVGSASPDSDLEPDDELTSVWDDHKVRLTRYYGKVPKYMLEEEATAPIDEDKVEDSSMVEAIIVIANGGVLLKAEASPYMMKDRPVFAFRWDKAPGRFFGRGICQKGYMSQKALDTEMRARIDGLALTVHPMLAMDARQIPRGFRPEVGPGKVILTQGPPREVLQPFNFGAVDQTTFTQTQSLQMMVQQATGAIDSAGMAGQVNGEATAAGISMGLGAIIKRHKRTLTMFQDEFLIPMVQSAAYRYMQYDPDNYPTADYDFTADSSLGIMAREYETTQLTQLMQSMPPESPAYNIILKAVVENMSLSNRQEILSAIDQANQPNPQAQQQQQQQMEEERKRLQELHQAQVMLLTSQAEDEKASAAKKMAEAQSIPAELEIQKIKAATTNLDDGVRDDIEFKRRLEVTDRVLQEKRLELEFKDKERERQFKAEQEQAKQQQAEQQKAQQMQQLKGMIGENKQQLEGVVFQ